MIKLPLELSWFKYPDFEPECHKLIALKLSDNSIVKGYRLKNNEFNLNNLFHDNTYSVADGAPAIQEWAYIPDIEINISNYKFIVTELDPIGNSED